MSRWRRNPGRCPDDAIGRRVRVRLANGEIAGEAGWPADGKGGCCWAKRGHPFDIAEYEVLK